MARIRQPILILLLAATALTVVTSTGSATAPPSEPFTASSYWRTPSTNPPDARSGAMISWLQSVLPGDRRFVTIRASHLNGSTAQGTTVYYAASSDHVYSICHNPRYTKYTFPPEATSVRIPAGAHAPTDNDADMIVYNGFAGRVFWFTNMQMISGKWCASQMSVYYTSSNGLYGLLPGSTNKHNWGKHGLAPITQAVRWGEVVKGVVPHVMDIYIPAISCHHAAGGRDYYPLYTGTMCTTSAANAIPAGAVIRIKPSVNLAAFKLNPYARVIANALQKYGAVVGDRSGMGNCATIKLEDTVDEGRGNLWANVGLTSYSLSGIPISDYQVDKLGAGR